MTVSSVQLDAFLARMDARRKREEAAEADAQEAEEQRIERQTAEYLKRTGRTAMTSTGTGKGPRLVEIEPD